MRKAEQTRWPRAPEYASITDGGNQTSSAWYQGKSAPLADPATVYVAIAAARHTQPSIVQEARVIILQSPPGSAPRG